MTRIARYEHAKTVTNRVCRLLLKEEFEGQTGFKSSYGFDEVACEFFRSQGRVKGAKVFEVFADVLYVDFDDCLDAAEDFYNKLVEMNISFELWDSGGRSAHFHIPHQPVWSKHLPYSHKQWMKALTDKADLSIYDANRIFRLPGTVHLKTFKQKVMIDQFNGELLNLPIIEEPARSFSATVEGEGVFSLCTSLQRLCSDPPKQAEHNRHMRLVALCAALREGGFSGDFAYELCTKVVDELMDEPLGEAEVGQIVSSFWS